MDSGKDLDLSKQIGICEVAYVTSLMILGMTNLVVFDPNPWLLGIMGKREIGLSVNAQVYGWVSAAEERLSGFPADG
jgi:hypothetical protein